MEYALEAENLTKVYGNKVVLFNFSLRIEKGKIFGLLGPNGAGKSTFIRMLSGLEAPDSGTLRILGEAAGAKIRRKIGVAPQDDAIYPLLTCMENLRYFGSLYGVSGRGANDKALALLGQLGLAEKKDSPAGTLSGGMRRRLNLACALMHNPEIIILDEPTTGLDPATRVQMWHTVREVVKANNATLLLTTHYMEEAEALCEQIAFVNSGMAVAQGTADELKMRVGREIAKITAVPGGPEKIAKIIEGLSGIDAVRTTEHGVIVEGDKISSRLPEISKLLEKNKQTVVEMSLSKPSLEDVFMSITGAKLREVGAVEHPKRN